MSKYVEEEDTRVCRCVDCLNKGKEQPIKNFPSNGKGGYRWQCKECMKKINKNWRSDKKEYIAEYNRNRK